MFKKENFSFSGGKDRDKLLNMTMQNKIIRFLFFIALFP
jgi:hypothetical protein